MDSKQASGLTMLGGLLLVVGSFLSWATVSGSIGSALEEAGEKASQTGTGGGDGWITLVIGLVLLVVGYLAFSGKGGVPTWLGWTAAVLGLAMAVFEYFSLSSDASDINDLIAQTGLDGKASIGIGFWLVALGAVVAIVGVAMSRTKKTA
ncbi:MAG: hypothetical protein A2Z12_09330 [Actinobacteria bacterium RBG_16_68_21]|nr:MAG: hypothetical protein A2Z12_09330 [Actinobacteria bacterium RBG_16_68_21]